MRPAEESIGDDINQTMALGEPCHAKGHDRRRRERSGMHEASFPVLSSNSQRPNVAVFAAALKELTLEQYVSCPAWTLPNTAASTGLWKDRTRGSTVGKSIEIA